MASDKKVVPIRDWATTEVEPLTEDMSEMCPFLLRNMTKETLVMELSMWKGQVEQFEKKKNDDPFWVPFYEDAVKRLSWVEDALKEKKK